MLSKLPPASRPPCTDLTQISNDHARSEIINQYIPVRIHKNPLELITVLGSVLRYSRLQGKILAANYLA